MNLKYYWKPFYNNNCILVKLLYIYKQNNKRILNVPPSNHKHQIGHGNSG
jgi:hypothetical protein